MYPNEGVPKFFNHAKMVLILYSLVNFNYDILVHLSNNNNYSADLSA
jgi:hypothetical protein